MIENPYAQEAEARWGQTDAFKESQRRTAKYGEADWAQMGVEQTAVLEAFLAAFGAGLTPDSVEAAAAAEAHRQQITKWFYPCSYEIQVGLAEMYVADERFKAYYDGHAVGLAKFVSEAIIANAVTKA